jgi:hypothetical protein
MKLSAVRAGATNALAAQVSRTPFVLYFSPDSLDTLSPLTPRKEPGGSI